MKKYRNILITFLTITMLVLTSSVPIITSKTEGPTLTPDSPTATPDSPLVAPDSPATAPGDRSVTPDDQIIPPDDSVCTTDNSSITPDVNNQFSIIIEKTVWNGNNWAKYAEVTLYDTVEFKGVVYNPTDYPIDFCGVIYDVFPENLRYINGSCTLLALSPLVTEIVDYENNTVYWYKIPILNSTKNYTFTYFATAVDCGEGINVLSTSAYVVIGGPGPTPYYNKIPVNDSDNATVFVNCCPPEPQILVEKMVWDGCEWSDYAEVDPGATVNFRVQIYNPNIELIRFSGKIYDVFPENLRYINHSLIVLREDNTWGEWYDWINNTVTWVGIKEINPGQYLNFTFNATAVGCGLGVNNIFVVSHIKIGGKVLWLNGTDDAAVNVNCTSPENPNISVEKYVKDICGQYGDHVAIDLGEWVKFKIIVTNTGDTALNITVWDALPDGLTYNYNATPTDPVIDGNNYNWSFENVVPNENRTITFKAIGSDYGNHTNTVKVIGTTPGGKTVVDDDDASVEVICDIGLDIAAGLERGNLKASITNNKETDLKDITWDITVQRLGLIKKIISTTTDTIELLGPNKEIPIQTESIRGFGRVKIEFKATSPDIGAVTTAAKGFILGRILIVFPS